MKLLNFLHGIVYILEEFVTMKMIFTIFWFEKKQFVERKGENSWKIFRIILAMCDSKLIEGSIRSKDRIISGEVQV